MGEERKHRDILVGFGRRLNGAPQVVSMESILPAGRRTLGNTVRSRLVGEKHRQKSVNKTLMEAAVSASFQIFQV
jgi:hypothetical protein